MQKRYKASRGFVLFGFSSFITNLSEGIDDHTKNHVQQNHCCCHVEQDHKYLVLSDHMKGQGKRKRGGDREV